MRSRKSSAATEHVAAKILRLSLDENESDGEIVLSERFSFLRKPDERCVAAA
jgi:hypothetical protein